MPKKSDRKPKLAQQRIPYTRGKPIPGLDKAATAFGRMILADPHDPDKLPEITTGMAARMPVGPAFYQPGTEARTFGVDQFGGLKSSRETVVPKSTPSERHPFEYDEEKAGDKSASKALDVGEPVLVDASAVPPKALAQQIKGAGDNPVLIQNAEALGFYAPEVMVVNRGKGKAKVKPEEALRATETPVLKTSDFVDTMSFIRKGMGQ